MSMHDDVQQAMRRVLIEVGGDTHIAISPTLLANMTYERFAEDGTESHVQWASIEHFKSLARRMLARQYDPDSDENEVYQGDMFSGTLQDRYPIPRGKGEEPLYKPRLMLSRSEVQWNVCHLRKGADARVRHADALEAFGDNMDGEQAA